MEIGGGLNRRERARLIAQAVAAQLAEATAGLPLRSRSRGAADPYDLARLRVPDSEVARAAEQLCAEVSPTFLANHCFRTFVWGTVLGLQDRVDHDEELLYVACMLHDLGLTVEFDRLRCFEFDGAVAAGRFAEEAGWGPERRELLIEAIRLHVNVKVPLASGPEAHLLHAGAGFDVIGRRRPEIASATVEEVLARHPRLDFKREFGALMRAQAEAKPGCRAHLFMRLGMGQLIARAPFTE